MISYATQSIAVWVLKITLASAPTDPSYYEFLSQADCESVKPAIEQLYLGLGESYVTLECSPSQEREVKPLATNMILSL